MAEWNLPSCCQLHALVALSRCSCCSVVSRSVKCFRGTVKGGHVLRIYLPYTRCCRLIRGAPVPEITVLLPPTPVPRCLAPAENHPLQTRGGSHPQLLRRLKDPGQFRTSWLQNGGEMTRTWSRLLYFLVLCLPRTGWLSPLLGSFMVVVYNVSPCRSHPGQSLRDGHASMTT